MFAMLMLVGIVMLALPPPAAPLVLLVVIHLASVRPLF